MCDNHHFLNYHTFAIDQRNHALQTQLLDVDAGPDWPTSPSQKIKNKKKEGAVTSCIPPARRSPSPAALALVSSPSAPVGISARWSASDEPSVGSYLVQGEAERETERSRPRRTDKERKTQEEEGVKRQGQFPTGRRRQFEGLELRRLSRSERVSCCHFGANERECRGQYCDSIALMLLFH